MKLGFGTDCGGRTEPSTWKDWTGEVPMDPSWKPSAGTDKSIVIVDTARQQSYSLWIVENIAGNPTACHGGRMTLAKTAAENSGETPGVYPLQGGATASSLPHDAGSISKEDVAYAREHGYFPHALYAGLPRTRVNAWSCPATRTDGTDTHPDAIMEGQRMRLKMTEAEVNALPTDFQRWVARTAARYGIIPGDTTADTAIIASVNDDAFWASFLPGQKDGSLADIPFGDRLEVLKPNTSCTNAPADRINGGAFNA